MVQEFACIAHRIGVAALIRFHEAGRRQFGQGECAPPLRALARCWNGKRSLKLGRTLPAEAKAPALTLRTGAPPKS
jgi:hypothetical protein